MGMFVSFFSSSKGKSSNQFFPRRRNVGTHAFRREQYICDVVHVGLTKLHLPPISSVTDGDLDPYHVTIRCVFKHDFSVHRRESPVSFRQARFFFLQIRLPLLQSDLVRGNHAVGLVNGDTV